MRNHLLATIAATMCTILLSTGPQGTALAADLELAIDEEMFTVNGTPRFLVFVSYFDAMDVSATNLHSDFAYLRSKGVHGVRIFPNWWDVQQDVWSFPNTTYAHAPDTLIAANGTLRSASLTKFRSVLDIAKQEGLLVDVSFSPETVKDCMSGTCDTLTLTEYRNGIVSVATNLAAAGSAYKHVLFDLANEYNRNGLTVGATPLTDAQILSIRNAVNGVDPYRIVTASISSGIPPGTAAAKETAANVDVIAWHEYRDPGFWNLVDDAIFAIQGVNSDPPIYLQEPERYRPGNQGWLTKAGFGADVRGAYVNGAAAWCFHNGGSFRMDGSNLQAKLQAEEKAFLTCLNSYMTTGGC
jgi:hypothetical protein